MEILWTIVGIVVPLLVGLGVALAVTEASPNEFKFARACFRLSALILSCMTVYWLFKTDSHVLLKLALWYILALGIILYPRSLKWVTAREQHLKTKNEIANELEAKFLDRDEGDIFFLCGAVRIVVTNKHPTRIARGIRVKLIEFDCSDWNRLERERCLKALNLPYSLPAKGGDQVIPTGYDIDQSSHRVFDFFGVVNDTRDRRRGLCIAPFLPPRTTHARSDQSVLGPFWINGEDDPGLKEFNVKIDVSCDGVKTLCILSARYLFQNIIPTKPTYKNIDTPFLHFFHAPLYAITYLNEVE